MSADINFIHRSNFRLAGEPTSSIVLLWKNRTTLVIIVETILAIIIPSIKEGRTCSNEVELIIKRPAQNVFFASYSRLSSNHELKF